MKKSTFTALIIAVLASHSACASDWFVRGGVTSVNPKSGNGTIAALDADVGSNTQLGITFGRQFSPNVALEVLASTPFTHAVSLNGLGKVGEFKHLPPTVSLQYYFNPEGKVSPFIGAGLNYTLTFSEKSKGAIAGNKLSVGNSFGLAAQAGLRFAVSEDWDMVLDARWMDIDAEVSLNGTRIGTANVDPMVYSLMWGKRF